MGNRDKKLATVSTHGGRETPPVRIQWMSSIERMPRRATAGEVAARVGRRSAFLIRCSLIASVMVLGSIELVRADSDAPQATQKPAVDSFPVTFAADGDTHLQFEATKPDDTSTKGTVFDETNLFGHVSYADWLTLTAQLNYENARFNDTDDFYPDRSSFLRSEALTLRQLYAEARPFDADVALYAGKFHAHFGSAWGDAMPGIFNNFGADYEQEERDGGGVEWGLPESVAPVLGNARLYVETFFLDNGPLSHSLLSRPSANDQFVARPGVLRLADGGAANTGDFSSATVALQGHKLFGIKGTQYQISYTHEGVGLTGDRTPAGAVPEKTENGVSAGLSYKQSIAPGVTMIPFVEYTHFNDFNGQNSLTADYYIAAVETDLGAKWEVDTTAGFRHDADGINRTDATDIQENIDLQYKVLDSLLVGIGLNHINANRSNNPAQVQYKGSETIGVSLSYDFTLK
jgi:hypothetical protein